MTPSSRRVNLDDPRSYQHLDPADMLGLTVGFPDQCEEAFAIGRTQPAPPGCRNPANIVVAGMGGSAIVGDFLAALFADELKVPLTVSRRYGLGADVGRRTLLIASSYSGNTEETLDALQEGIRRRARIVCITSGGRMADIARRHRLPRILIPGGRPPRASTGYSFLPLVVLLEKLGLVPEHAEAHTEALQVLRRLRRRLGPDAPTSGNPAKSLAKSYSGRMPIIYGTSGLMGAVAFRWQTQLNENSKVLALSHELPELNHNEVAGWGLSRRLARNLVVTFLTRPDDSSRIQARVRITRDIVAAQAPVHLVRAGGRSRLAQLLYAMYLGDFVSVYLAFLNGADPVAIPAIDRLKRRLARLR